MPARELARLATIMAGQCEQDQSEYYDDESGDYDMVTAPQEPMCDVCGNSSEFSELSHAGGGGGGGRGGVPGRGRGFPRGGGGGNKRDSGTAFGYNQYAPVPYSAACCARTACTTLFAGSEHPKVSDVKEWTASELVFILDGLQWLHPDTVRVSFSSHGPFMFSSARQ